MPPLRPRCRCRRSRGRSRSRRSRSDQAPGPAAAGAAVRAGSTVRRAIPTLRQRPHHATAWAGSPGNTSPPHCRQRCTNNTEGESAVKVEWVIDTLIGTLRCILSNDVTRGDHRLDISPPRLALPDRTSRTGTVTTITVAACPAAPAGATDTLVAGPTTVEEKPPTPPETDRHPGRRLNRCDGGAPGTAGRCRRTRPPTHG